MTDFVLQSHKHGFVESSSVLYVLESLTASFLFLSEIKYSTNLINIYTFFLISTHFIC